MLKPRRYLELAVLALIVGVLAVFLVRALEKAREDVEKAAVQAEVAALRVELLDRLAHREIAGGRLPGGRNPVVWAGRQPQGYVGEREKAPPERGLWFYDQGRQELVYRYRAGGEVRYRLSIGEGGVAAPGKLAGIGLVQVTATQTK